MRPEVQQALRTTLAVHEELEAKREALRRAAERGDAEETLRLTRQLFRIPPETEEAA